MDIDLLTKIEIALAALFELTFFLIFIRTKWYKKELGPYIFRKQLGFSIIMLFVFGATFFSSFPREYLRPIVWLLVVFIFGEQLLRLIMDKYKASIDQK